MNDQIKSAIHKVSVIAATTAAVLSPIPLADEIAMLPLYGYLTHTIGRHHGLRAGQIPWKPIAFTAVNGLAARAAANLAVAFLPGVAAVANATSAVFLTEAFGRYVDAACADPASAQPYSARRFIEMFRERATAARAA